MGALQLLGMRHLVRLLGKHMMLITGNVFLAAGMLGVAFSRNPVIHFAVRRSSFPRKGWVFGDGLIKVFLHESFGGETPAILASHSENVVYGDFEVEMRRCS